MPRPNPPRDVFAERHLAVRIAREREDRGWSYESLASRMTAAGCPLNQPAIYKIERGGPPRRITVDELVAYSRVFGIAVEHLLLDPEVEAEARIIELLDQWRELFAERLEMLDSLREREESLMSRMRDLVKGSRNASKALDAYFSSVFPNSHWADDFPKMVREEA